MRQVLVFASSIHQVDAIVNKLLKNNIDTKAIHSKKNQGSRTEALAEFKSERLRVLVAPDLMARGIDISAFPYVINYELPRSPKDYIHRIGRTGRAGVAGDAISLVSVSELAHFEVIQKKMGRKVSLLDHKEIQNLQASLTQPLMQNAPRGAFIFNGGERGISFADPRRGWLHQK